MTAMSFVKYFVTKLYLAKWPNGHNGGGPWGYIAKRPNGHNGMSLGIH